MNDTRKIFKYLITVTDESDIFLPAGARILSVIEQRENIVLYAIVPVPSDPDVVGKVSIRVVGTGHEIKFSTTDYTFLGTVSLYGGQLVFHIFYRDWGYSG